MNIKKLIIASTAVAASAALHAAVPEISGVTMTQDSERLVTITYTLSAAPAVVTLDVQTNATADAASDDPGWTSIGGGALWNAMGDVWKQVEMGNRTITWHPDNSWPDHKIDGNRSRAVVTAWALDNTPDYMVVDLAVDNTVRYFPGVDFLPKKSFDQVGAAVTNNPDYKTTKLLMRKIMAQGIEWTKGSTAQEVGQSAYADREAPHLVTLTNNYYIGVFEVTQAQWERIQPNRAKPSYFNNSSVYAIRPVETVCYNEIRNAANSTEANTAYDWPKDPNPGSFLGKLHSKTGIRFDLPSEAQWEFAARAGNGDTKWGDGSTILDSSKDANLDKLGRYERNGGKSYDGASYTWPARSCGAENGTAIVGSYAPNSWGLYDMAGNVHEWCLDWYEVDITANEGKVNVDPEHPEKSLSGNVATKRVKRGGEWGSVATASRPAFRSSDEPNVRSSNTGFRVICYAGLR